jgi:hypothetical protein
MDSLSNYSQIIDSVGGGVSNVGEINEAKENFEKKKELASGLIQGLSEPLITDGLRDTGKAILKKVREKAPQAIGDELENIANDAREGGLKNVVSKGLKRNANKAISKAREVGEDLQNRFNKPIKQALKKVQVEAKVKLGGDEEINAMKGIESNDPVESFIGKRLLKSRNNQMIKRVGMLDNDEAGEYMDKISNGLNSGAFKETPSSVGDEINNFKFNRDAINDILSKREIPLAPEGEFKLTGKLGVKGDTDTGQNIGNLINENKEKFQQAKTQISQDTNNLRVENVAPQPTEANIADNPIKGQPDTSKLGLDQLEDDADKPTLNGSGGNIAKKGKGFKNLLEEDGEEMTETDAIGGGVEDVLGDVVSLGVGISTLVGGLVAESKAKQNLPKPDLVNPAFQLGA